MRDPAPTHLEESTAVGLPATVWPQFWSERKTLFLLASLVFVAVAVPITHLFAYSLSVAVAYTLSRSTLGRNQRLALIISPLVGLLLVFRTFHPHPIPFVLWSGMSIKAFFILRAIDYAVSNRPRSAESLSVQLRDMLLYFTFLPTLFAGPVPVFSEFQKSYQPAAVRSPGFFQKNFIKFIWGTIKFVWLAHAVWRLTEWARQGVQGAGFYGLDERLLLLLGAATDLIAFYLLFSGFCDMMIALARFLGFQLGENFAHPLLLRSPSLYWRTWNISVYKWMMAHVFYPYWKLKQVPLKIFSVIFVSGLWHLCISMRLFQRDAVIQLYAATLIYALVAFTCGRLARSKMGIYIAQPRPSYLAIPIITAQIVATFLFTTLFHQLFIGGFRGRPLEETLGFFKHLFLG